MPRKIQLYDGTETALVDASGNLQVVVAAGTAAFGKLAANSGVDIGDVDVTSIAAGTNLIGKVSIDQVTANANEVVLKAGTAAFGKLAANSGVDIGDVDVTSLPALAAGTALIGKVSIDQVTANANEVVVKSALPAGTALLGKVSIDQVTANANEVVLKAGTASIGVLGANSGVDIGDVTLNAGTAEIGKLAAGVAVIGSLGGLGILVPATVYFDDAVAADVDAAVGANANLRLVGFAARESAAAPAIASCYVVNGATGAAAGKVVPIALAASGMASQWFGPEGIPCPLGLSIDWEAGEIDISLYYKIVAVA